MITHFGLYWKERNVFWGRQKNPGQLLGKSESKKTDYRNYVGLYCLYGEGQLLYIGEAGLGTNQSIFNRLKSHRRGAMAGRWDSFSWFGRNPDSVNEKIKALDSLQQLEAIAIAIINPGFNKQNGNFAKAHQVYQEKHDEAEGDLESKIAKIWDRISKD